MSTKPTLPRDAIIASLLNLRKEIMPKAYDLQGRMRDSTYAEMIWKLNSCLFTGYPSAAALKPPAFEAPHSNDPVALTSPTLIDDRGMTCKTL